MPDYKYTEIVYCNNCDNILWRDPQFYGFTDTVDMDLVTTTCDNCGSDDLAKKLEKEDQYL